jgi:hypothetical protein
MTQSSLVRKAVAIDKSISTLGLTPSERSSFVADRLTIEKYLPTSANVMEIGSRPSVSLFVEKRKDADAKHIVLDNEIGDRSRLKELITMNQMSLQVVPMEDFVDIYSYDAIVIDDREGELIEVLKDFPLEKVNVVIVGENDKDDENRNKVFETLSKSGFERAEVVVESAGEAGKRDVAVFKRKAVEEKKVEVAPATVPKVWSGTGVVSMAELLKKKN